MPRLPLLGRAFLILFAISTAFPVVAALLPADRVPHLLGLADVAIAAVTVILGFTLESQARTLVTDADRATAWRLVRVGTSVLLVLLGVFFLAPGLFRWEILLVGLAWRAWLGVLVLPSVLASMRRSATSA